MRREDVIQGAGLVTASSKAAAQAGARILRNGGNAVDAAVATAIASCVADPGNTGLGGYGGHMVVARRGADPLCVDFNMSVPMEGPAVPAVQTYPNTGPGASAIPNVVAGLALALSRLGSITWAEVSEPAYELAAAGVAANSSSSRAFKEVEGAAFVQECFSFESSFVPGRGSELHFRQPALARILQIMARNGPGWFYEGPIRDRACEIFQNAGYRVTPKQWAEAPHTVSLAPAASMEIGTATLYSAPLGTSGSASMFATVAAGKALSTEAELHAPAAVLSWARSLAKIWSYRFDSPEGNDFRAATATTWVERALRFQATGGHAGSTGHTCHLNTCDRNGTFVALTLTHGPFWFGGRWALPQSGIIMNAGMHLLIAAPPIACEGRLYGVTNMCPTIVRLSDGSMLALGCPGARRIPTMIGLVLARHIFGGVSLQEAISQGRFHAEKLSKVTIERERWDTAVYDCLKSAFEEIENEEPSLYYGPLTAIRREPDGRFDLGLDDRIWKGFAETTG
jgi:gamma-glutamyltranspeptidase / glutathione hydrolase